jgi:hypothetical protein
MVHRRLCWSNTRVLPRACTGPKVFFWRFNGVVWFHACSLVFVAFGAAVATRQVTQDGSISALEKRLESLSTEKVGCHCSVPMRHANLMLLLFCHSCGHG